MSANELLGLALHSFERDAQGRMFVREMPRLKGASHRDNPVVPFDTCGGEKPYESLVSRETMVCVDVTGCHFGIPVDNRDLNASFCSCARRNSQLGASAFYRSERLNVEQLNAYLCEKHFIKRELWAPALRATSGLAG
jgi:hypothetical protein